MGEKIIELKNIKKTYDNGFTAVTDFNLYVNKGEFITFLGPSGCGKTTTLRMIAGFELPTEGEILLNGRNIAKLPPYERPINTVFQRYALFPHMNIYENIAFGLRQKKLPEDTIKRKVKKALELVDLEGFERRSVATLSGGQQQRIAIARAVVNEPQILLLDEPLGALDLKMRKEMQLELKEMHERLGGESNIFNGIMTGKLKARFAGGEWNCVDDIPEGTHITAVVRPEDVLLTAPEHGTITGTVSSVIFKGIHYEITVVSGKSEMVVQSVHSARVGENVGMRVNSDNIHIMIAEDNTNYFAVDINAKYHLEFNGRELDASVTKLIKGSRRLEDGTVVDGSGDAIEPSKTKIMASIGPENIDMTDRVEDGLVDGYISNLIYKGDHYSYVIHTDLGQDFVVDDEDLWNMGDHVGLIMPVDKMDFKVRR